MKKRNLALMVVFSILTAGLYDLYLFVTLTNVSNELDPKHATAGGVKALLFLIFTLGLYSIYWAFRMGQKLATVTGDKTDIALGVLIGFPFIMWVLQGNLNKAIDEGTITVA